MARSPQHPSHLATRLARGRQVLQLRDAGRTWPQVAAELGIGERTAKRAGREASEADRPRLGELDPEEIAARAVTAQVAALARLEELCDRELGENAAVGAAKGAAAVGTDVLRSLTQLGLLPDWGRARLRDEMLATARELIAAARQAGVTDDVAERVFTDQVDRLAERVTHPAGVA